MGRQPSKSRSPRGRSEGSCCPGFEVHEMHTLSAAKRSTRSTCSHQREPHEDQGRAPPRRTPKCTVSTEETLQEQHLAAKKGCVRSYQRPSEDSKMLQNEGGSPSGKRCRKRRTLMLSSGTNDLSIGSGSNPSSRRRLQSEDITMVQCEQRMQQNEDGSPSAKRRKSLKGSDDLSMDVGSNRSSQPPSEDNAMPHWKQKIQQNADGSSRRRRTSVDGPTDDFSMGICSSPSLLVRTDQGILKCGNRESSDQSEAIALWCEEKSFLMDVKRIEKTMKELFAEKRRLEQELVAAKRQLSDSSFNKGQKRKQNEAPSREPASLDTSGFTGKSENIPELTNLRYTSDGRELRVELEIGAASGEDKPLAPLSGSYTDESATPNHLDKAVAATKNEVKRFQKRFFKSLISRLENPLDRLDPDHVVFLGRSSDLGFLVRSYIYRVFFTGFENESFDTISGVSRFLDPDLRQKKYFEYYCRGEKPANGDIDDALFEEFCKEKASCLQKTFPSCDDLCLNCQIGDSEPLSKSFRKAAKSVWLLHKLAFSFEPPASIFRVKKGAELNPRYMETIVTLEDDQRFIPNVSFMVSPGLRLRTIVMKCEVYLSGAATTDSQSPKGPTLEDQPL